MAETSGLNSTLTAMFWAVASCSLVHILFAAVGAGPILHTMGQNLGEFFGMGDSAAAACCSPDQIISSPAPIESSLPAFEFKGDSLTPAR